MIESSIGWPNWSNLEKEDKLISEEWTPVLRVRGLEGLERD
jgi:hypothetical protein